MSDAATTNRQPVRACGYAAAALLARILSGPAEAHGLMLKARTALGAPTPLWPGTKPLTAATISRFTVQAPLPPIYAQGSAPAATRGNRALRPLSFGEYVGQAALMERLKVAVAGAKARKEPMDHLLLHGGPGLGKTTVALLVASEMGTRAHLTCGTALTKVADAAALLAELEPGDVLFVDEVHALPTRVCEFLLTAMEDYHVDVPAADGGTERIDLPPFTLVAATTKAGGVPSPMRARFGIVHRLEPYPIADLVRILQGAAAKMGLPCTPGALDDIAARSRGTPRLAVQRLRRARDVVAAEGRGELTEQLAARTMVLEGVDGNGLDTLDRAYLAAIADGNPAGLDAIAAAVGEDPSTLEDAVEPHLIRSGLVSRGRNGRAITQAGLACIE